MDVFARCGSCAVAYRLNEALPVEDMAETPCPECGGTPVSFAVDHAPESADVDGSG